MTAPAPRRSGYTAHELADRWDVAEPVATTWLHDFREIGLAVERRGLWQATRTARTRYRWLVELEPQTRRSR
jgi:transposase